MKNNKKHITKLFYKFLVDNGVMFQVIAAIDQTKHKTLEEHCKRCKVTNYTKYIYAYTDNNTLGGKEWNDLNVKWVKFITNYLNNKK